MAKVGEVNYVRNLRADERRHAAEKPYSDPNCAYYLYELGALLALMPPPPGRLLDVGCGTGWTSRFFARRGYEVLGIDICPDMIEAAQRAQQRERIAALQFRVGDYEEFAHDRPFDIAVFYDSLHHAVDEEAALRCVFDALKPGGVCLTSEPGVGHADSPEARAAVARFGVTEKDMPPRRIVEIARRIGYRCWAVYPHGFDVAQMMFRPPGRLLQRIPAWLGPLRHWARALRVAATLHRRRLDHGITVLTK
ncbi:MAG: class I SAM-dependent methyltransferase [Gemmataceae bacterium]|nr:class I SAM-dependent methyltransferase [Gemmataceae bacterium]